MARGAFAKHLGPKQSRVHQLSGEKCRPLEWLELSRKSGRRRTKCCACKSGLKKQKFLFLFFKTAKIRFFVEPFLSHAA
ncbi:MAG TPA: hypothetical protein VMB71_02820 [Acetobacteraceae bacterium]|nr:hypothetical protein [Acetobacteraceae bacterium]